MKVPTYDDLQVGDCFIAVQCFESETKYNMFGGEMQCNTYPINVPFKIEAVELPFLCCSIRGKRFVMDTRKVKIRVVSEEFFNAVHKQDETNEDD